MTLVGNDDNDDDNDSWNGGVPNSWSERTVMLDLVEDAIVSDGHNQMRMVVDVVVRHRGSDHHCEEEDEEEEDGYYHFGWFSNDHQGASHEPYNHTLDVVVGTVMMLMMIFLTYYYVIPFVFSNPNDPYSRSLSLLLATTTGSYAREVCIAPAHLTYLYLYHLVIVVVLCCMCYSQE